MAQHAAKKGGGVEHEPGPGSQSNNRSHHHVEQVIARIFAKRQAPAKEPFLDTPIRSPNQVFDQSFVAHAVGIMCACGRVSRRVKISSAR